MTKRYHGHTLKLLFLIRLERDLISGGVLITVNEATYKNDMANYKIKEIDIQARKLAYNVNTK